MHAAGASNFRFVAFVFNRRISLWEQGFNFEAKNTDKRNAYHLGGDADGGNGTSQQLKQLVRMKFIDPKPEPNWLDPFGKSTAGQRDRVAPPTPGSSRDLATASRRWNYTSAVDNHWNARAPRSSAAQDEPRSSATQDQAEAFSMTGWDQWGQDAAPARVHSDAASSNSWSRS